MKCNLCPRKCNADREKQEGVCRMPWDIYAARADSAYVGRTCISGENGQVPYFLRAVPCGAYSVRITKLPRENADRRLMNRIWRRIFLKLQQQKANNINLVTPTQYVLPIIAAVKKSKSAGIKNPRGVQYKRL